MNRNLLSLLFVFLSYGLFAQFVVQENFETTPLSVTSSYTGTGGIWALNSNFYSQGLQSDSAVVTANSQIYLTTNSFSTLGKHSIFLQFDQICKIDMTDSAFVQYSIDGGATFQNIDAIYYLGSGAYSTMGNRFSSISYADWLRQDTTLVTNTMWKTEMFDISNIVSDEADVIIRFNLSDGGLWGTNGGAIGPNNYPGWFIDSLSVTATISEVVPPTISLLEPIIQDTAYSGGPYNVGAYIYDLSGLDTAICIYNVMPDNIYDTLTMVLDPATTDSFYCDIPFYGFGHTISYYVKAVDDSYAKNTDSTVIKSFFCKNSPGGTFVIGDGSTSASSTVGNPFGQYYTGNKNQFLILASELQAMGAGGGNIASIAFDVTTINNPTSDGSNHNDFAIKIKSTSSASLGSTFETGLTQVYSVATYQTVVGWNTFTFSTPFVWDGTSNIVIETCFDNGASNYSGNAGINVNTTTFNSVINKYSDAASNECAETSGSASTTRPDMKIVLKVPSTLPNDIGVNGFTSPVMGAAAGTSIPVVVNLKNYGADTITTATIDWVYDGISQTAFSFTDSLKADSVYSNIAIGNITPSAGAHKITAWSSLPNGNSDIDISNDTTNFDFYACSGGLSGTYTIGGLSADYVSFHDAVLAINQCGISGAVTFNVNSGTYNENFELYSVNGASATNTITFQSASGDSSDVTLAFDATGTVDNYVVKLNGASYVSFKNMTFEAQDANYARVFVLSDTIHDFNLNNNIIKTTIVDTLYDSRMSLIIALDSTIGNNINISNNALTNGSYAISLIGDTTDASSWIVNNNIIYGHSSKAILLINAVSAQVIANDIMADTSSHIEDYNGIYLENNSGSPLVSKNKLFTTGTSYGYGISFVNSVFDTLSLATISNNFIQIFGNTSSTSLSCGILVFDSKNINIYYNSIRATGSMSASSALSLYTNTAGNVKNINIVNNNLTNDADGYIYYIKNVDTALFTNNHNDIFKYSSDGTFAYLGTAISSFDEWVTATGGLKLYNIDPYFVDSMDLHTQNNLLNGLGTPIAGITDDIDGDVRNVTTPDIGADEFDPSPFDIVTLDVLSPAGSCGLTSSEVVMVRLKNIGSDTINGGFTANYRIKGSTTVVSESIATVILPGDTLDYTFTTTVDLDVSSFGMDSLFEFEVWGDLSGDNFSQNDTSYLDVFSGFIPSTPVITSDTVNYGQTATISAVGNAIYFWADDTISTYLVKGSSYTTPLLYDTTTYYVSDRAGSGMHTAQCGNGTTTTNYAPNYGYYNYSWSRMLYEASEIGLAGIIDSMSFFVNNNPSNYIMDNQRVYLSMVNYTSITDLNYIDNSTLTQVFDGTITYDSAGEYTIVFSTPFAYDGVSSLVVQWENYDGTYSSGYPRYKATNIPGKTVYKYRDSSFPDVVGLASAYRPNMKIYIEALGCYSNRVPTTVIVEGFPSADAGLTSIVNPSGTVPAGSPQIVQTEIYNYGLDPLTSVDIIWSKTGSLPDTFNYTGNIAYHNTDTVTLDTVSFDPGIQSITAWTNNPNNIVDTINTNDTTHFSFKACLNGTYTIGSSPTADFANFSDAISTLNDAGICGDVIFNVDTGTYNEQIIIPEIVGTDANNTITFQSANGDSTGVILQYVATSYSAGYTVFLNGVDYLTFKGITFKGLGSDYAVCVQIGGESNHCTFINDVFESNISAYISRGIYSSNGKDNYLTILNNNMINTNSGIYVSGNYSENEVGTIIKNNTIKGFKNSGIRVGYTDSAEVVANTITSRGGTGYSYYGMYFSNCKNGIKVMNNKVSMKMSGTATGINTSSLEGTPSNRVLIANNMISINSGSGTNKGIRLAFFKNADIYYNSVNITSGNTSSRALDINSYGAMENVSIKNNILKDSVGYAIYNVNASTTMSVDNNDYYTNSQNIAYWGGENLTSLRDLQDKNGMDINSINKDFHFVNDTVLYLADSVLLGFGTPFSSVPTDIDGNTRSLVATTIGAQELPLLNIDINIATILDITDTTVESHSYDFRVIVRNFGLTDITDNFDIKYSIEGSTPISYTYTDTLFTGLVDTVQLAAFISPEQYNTIKAYSVYNLDSNQYNDTAYFTFFGVPGKDANMLSVSPIEPYCGITFDTVKVKLTNVGIDTINGSNQISPTTISYNKDDGNSVTETFTTVVAPYDTVEYTFSTLIYLGTNNFVDSTYNIKSWISFIGDNNKANDTAANSIDVPHVPEVPTVISPTSTPYGTQANLVASAVDSLFWYKDDTSTVLLGEGGNYTTPYLYTDDTFRVNTVYIGGTVDNTIGDGDNESQPLPLNMYFGYTYSQSIFLPSDFNDISGTITKISYYYNGNSTISGDAIDIYMGTPSNSSFASNTDWVAYNDLTLVYSGTLNTTTTAGWITFTLNTPFAYNGRSNLVVAFDENTPGYHSYSDKFYCTQVSSDRSIRFYSDGTNPDPMSPPTTGWTLGTSSYIPNVKFEIIPIGCSSPRVPVAVTVGAQSADDVGVVALAKPTDGIFKTNNDSVAIKVKNFGTNSQSNIPVSYIVDGGSVSTGTVPGPIASGDTAIYTFAQTADFSIIGNTYNIIAYTSLTGDATALNDTLNIGVTNEYPDYCISKATYSGYSDLTNVIVGSVFSNSSAPSGNMYTNFMSTVAPAFVQIGVQTKVSLTSAVPPGTSNARSGFDKIYIDFNKDGDFEDANEEVFYGASINYGTVIGSFTIPSSVTPGITAMRVIHALGDAIDTATDVTPCGTYDYGETEDYLVNIVQRIPNDLGVEKILNFTTVSNTQTPNLVVRVRNFGTNPISTFDIKYTINNGIVNTYTYSLTTINPTDSMDINVGVINLDQGSNIITAYTELLGDSVNINDTSETTTFVTAFGTLSYFDNFEGNNLWFNDTIVNQWELGAPTASNINTAHSPVNVWAINLDGSYADNSDDRLYTPLFIIPNNVDSAYIKFWHYIDCRSSDGGFLQFKNGKNGYWLSAGIINDGFGTNWVNKVNGGTHMWSHVNSGWMHSVYKMHFGKITNSFYGVAAGDTLSFRFVFSSDGPGNGKNGWAIDDFSIELPGIPNDVGVVAITSPNVNTQVGSSVATIKVKNHGTTIQTSIPVSYSVNGGSPVTAIFTPSGSGLKPDSTEEYTFNTTFMAPGTTFDFCAKTSLVGDLYAQNDEMCTSITPTAANNDVGIVSVEVDPFVLGVNGVDTTRQSYNTVCTVKIVNYGINTQTSIPVEFAAGGAPVGSETWTGSLAQGDTATYTFTTTYHNPIGNYQLCAKTNLSVDADNANDEGCHSYIGLYDVGIDGSNGLLFTVNQNEPNPAFGKVNINYVLPKSGKIHFELRSSLGQIITSIEETHNGGSNTMIVDVNKLSNGIYYYTFEFDGKRITRKMVVNQ